MKINTSKENLEKALGSLKEDASKKPSVTMTKEEEIGFHKGALNTLAAERNELVKIIVNVETIMQAHLKRLEELGVKIETREAKETKK
ncbi:MAG: hypothetical protein PHH54_06485 [Candidatus Nanoarchaeia archaeon]|nr:hypothetical protein [Candidatus Nanoarchaeia archaeon]MDD5741603.1 hypothetical protein [Candidatus Nanoarchaeia archaeon]